MMKQFTKEAIRRAAALFGCEIHRMRTNESTPHGIDSMEQFLSFLSGLGFRPRCILDVGANRTDWSALAARVFPDARFVLIEPQQEMLPFLNTFCASRASARFVLAGAGAEPGKSVQTIFDDLNGSTFLPAPSEEQLRAGRQRETPIITIDSLFTEDQWLPDLVKLDIQGFELEALKGASKLFGHTECFVLEVSLHQFIAGMPDVFQVVEFMHQRGYKVYDICGFLRRPLDDALGQIDLAFAKANGRLCDNRWRKE